MPEDDIWYVVYRNGRMGVPQRVRPGMFFAFGQRDDFLSTLDQTLRGDALVIDPRTGERLLPEGINILEAGNRRNGKGGEAETGCG